MIGGAAGAMALVFALAATPLPSPDQSDSAALHPVTVPDLRAGMEGPVVAELQEALASAGFRPGPADGRFGGATVQAVFAFEKHWGLERDGVFEAGDWDLLQQRPTVRWRPEATRVEIDLDKQVLYLVEDHRLTAVVAISSGNGETYRNFYGNVARANTPEGKFSFYFQRNYNHQSYLGAMYKPYYFLGGYAIHGSPSVPPWPASHGCIRVTNADMDWLRPHLSIGMTVYVYGKRTENPPVQLPESETGPIAA